MVAAPTNPSGAGRPSSPSKAGIGPQTVILGGGQHLVGRSDNHAGDVSGFAPPGDIHRVHNTADTTAISIHIYGTDITRIGSSVRRYYD